MLGLFFVVIAGTFVIGLLGAFYNLNELSELEKAGAWFVSLGGLAAGIWFIYSNPGTKLNFDKDENLLTVQRRGLMRNEIEKYRLGDIADFKLVESEDSEGDPVYRIELQLNGGNRTNLTELWINNKEGLQKDIDSIKNFLTIST
jgi:hypothetical protein